MLKTGDVVYRVNLKEGTVDQLEVKNIIYYKDDGSFEFELTSCNCWWQPVGSYKFKAWQQTEAEDKMKSECLIFNLFEEAETYVYKELKRVSKELDLFEQLELQCFDLKYGFNTPK